MTIVNEPDMWVVGVEPPTVTHVTDPGPTYRFQAPILWMPGMPDWLEGLEFGCEVAFMKKHGRLKPKTLELYGKVVKAYETADDRYRVVLFVSQDDDVPVVITFYKHREMIVSLYYDTYVDDLEFDETLFQGPDKGVDDEITQAPN